MQSYVLAKYAYETMGFGSVAAIRYNGRYGRVGVKEFKEASRRLGHPVSIELKFNNGETDFKKRLEWVQRQQPDAVFVWGNAVESALIVKQMREMGMDQPVLGSDRMIHPDFVEIAGAAGEGVVATSPWDPTQENPRLELFRKRYRERYDQEPETYAAHAYDGMAMLLEAIDEAGLNRALIRDALERRKHDTFVGVTGPIPLNDIYTDAGPITLATLKNGAWHYRSEEEAGIFLPRVVKKAEAEASAP
jgi:ABC-type branched-subunit amino acid transport system substrate-binding protein